MDSEELRHFARSMLPTIESMLALARGAEKFGMDSVPRPLGLGYMIGARAALELAKRYLDDAVGQP